MNLKTYQTKSIMLFASVLSIISLLVIGVSPAFAKTSSDGPIRVSAVAVGASTDTLSADFHRDLTQYNRLKYEISLAKDMNLNSIHLVSSDHSRQYSSADLKNYQSDLMRAGKLSSDLASLFTARGGFNKDGVVTNAAMARATLNSMNPALVNGLYWARQALHEYSLAKDNRIR